MESLAAPLIRIPSDRTDLRNAFYQILLLAFVFLNKKIIITFYVITVHDDVRNDN